LVPIVIFQIVSSVISLTGTGVTYTRYYVILFGIFAALAGVIMSIVPVRKNGVIAALLIIFTVISVIPPVDAFTLSRRSQTNMLKNVLVKNNMLVNGSIKPNSSIPEEDKKKISTAVSYLSMMEYVDRIEWFHHKFNSYDDFYKTFGFNQYEVPNAVNQSVYVGIEQQAPVNITGYDSFVYFNVQINDRNNAGKICDIVKDDRVYTLSRKITNDQCDVLLTGENKKELIRYPTREIFDKFYNYSAVKGQISADQATFIKENETAKITIVVQNLNINKNADKTYYMADLYAFVKIK
jgi:hypothetical protein